MCAQHGAPRLQHLQATSYLWQSERRHCTLSSTLPPSPSTTRACETTASIQPPRALPALHTMWLCSLRVCPSPSSVSACVGSMRASATMTPRIWMGRCDDGCANRIAFISPGMWWFRRRTRSLWESLRKRPDSSRAETRGIPTRRMARMARGHCSDEASWASRSQLLQSCLWLHGYVVAPPQLGVHICNQIT